MNSIEVIKIFFTALISTLGAFVPIFLLMCIHFCVRKSAYAKRRNRLLELKTKQEVINKINQDALKSLYSQLGVDNVKDFVDKSISLGSNRWEAIALLQKQLDLFRGGEERVLDITLSISYIDEYSFITYIGTLLDNHFPDKRLE